MFQTLALATIAWGALAFGAVYPWAYRPLLAAAAVTGIAGLVIGRRSAAWREHRAIFVALVIAIGIVGLQLVPLPLALLAKVSPNTVSFLENYDLRFAAGGAVHHPLTIDTRATWVGLALLLGFTLLFVGTTAALSARGARSMVTAIVGFGVLVALIGIVQKALIGDHAYMGMRIYGFWKPESLLVQPFGPYVNRNHFAGWMVMALPLALGFVCGMLESGLSHTRPGWRNRVLWWSTPEGGRSAFVCVGILLMILSLVMSMSRSGMASFVAAMSVVVLLFVRRLRSGGPRLAALSFFVLLIALPALWMGVGATVDRFADSSGSMQTRIWAWRDARSVIRDFPVAGTGFNTYGTATVIYQTGNRDVHFQEAHSDFLQVMAEGGLLLSIPVLVLAGLFVRAVWRQLRNDRNDSAAYWLRLGAATGLFAIALQSLVEFSLQMPGNAALFAVLCGIAIHTRPVRAGA